jgi:glycosyltransferase involved in cell wall biosynthesis
LKIAYFITRSDAIGGAHVHVRDLSRALMDRGHEVRVLVGGEGPFTEQLRERGVPYCSLKHSVRPVRPWSDLRALGEVRGRLREFGPDLLSTHSAKAGWIGRTVGRSLGVPTLFTAHGWSFTEGKPAMERRFYIGLERLTASLAGRIITVSDYDRDLALRNRVAPPGKIVTVHNGMPDVAAGLRAAPAAPVPRFISVARFEEPKDHPSLIRALGRLKEVPGELEIVGDGPLMPRSQRLAEELGVAPRIRFLGLRSDVAELMAGAHAFVLVSDWEGFPRSILEAMRAGLPVVASDVGGVRESVEEGVTGFRVPRGDLDALTDRLSRLAGDPSLRAEMGARGRRRYEAEFTFERMLEETLAVYREVTGSGRGTLFEGDGAGR